MVETMFADEGLDSWPSIQVKRMTFEIVFPPEFATPAFEQKDMVLSWVLGMS